MTAAMPKRPLLGLLLLVLLPACTQDPMDRPGTWHATGANQHNLAAMVVDTAHLQAGVAAETERGAVGSNAVARLLDGRRAALPLTGASRIGLAPAGGVAPGAAQQQQQGGYVPR